MTSYPYLFEFLKCVPYIQQLKLHFTKVDANLVLDLMYLLQPSLKELAIVGKHSSKLLNIDLSFMRLFNLVYLKLESDLLPAVILSRVVAMKGSNLSMIEFEEFSTTDKTFFLFQNIYSYRQFMV